MSSETNPLLPGRSTTPSQRATDIESSPTDTTDAERGNVRATSSIYAVIPVLLLGTVNRYFPSLQYVSLIDFMLRSFCRKWRHFTRLGHEQHHCVLVR